MLFFMFPRMFLYVQVADFKRFELFKSKSEKDILATKLC